MEPFPKKENAPNYSNPAVQQAFIQEIKDGKTLMQKELEVNLEEQNLLNKRLVMMKQFLNELPSSDPQYSMLALQVKMDQIELDEKKIRETLIIQRIEEIK